VQATATAPLAKRCESVYTGVELGEIMHRRTPLLWVLIAQVGCSSTWILDVDAALQCTEDRKLSWWQDNDGDGWGQGVDADGVAVEPIRECDGFQDAALVRNGLDCDDTTANLADTVTGAISGFCPLDLVYNPTPPQTIQYVGLRSAEDEYVAFYGTTPLDYGSLANANCGAWGELDADGLPTAHLATFETYAEAKALMDTLETELGSTRYAAFIDRRLDEQIWDWQAPGTGAPDELFNHIGWCGTTPPDATRFTQLALVFRGTANDWCLGSAEGANLPDETGPYTRYQAHFICERPAPDPADPRFDWFPPLVDPNAQ